MLSTHPLSRGWWTVLEAPDGMTNSHPGEKDPERRAARRFVLALPLEVCIASEQTEPLRGATRDASSRGLYFVLDHELPVGSDLHIILTLPKKISYGTELSLCAYGKVVRTEPRKEADVDRVGIGATMESYYFIRTKDFPV